MAYYMAVANRKGGVGKSTCSVMLAHAFSVWGGRRVLIVDVDPQCNSSMILVGGDAWHSACQNKTTIADYVRDQCNGAHRSPNQFLLNGIGDVSAARGAPPMISLLPGSVIIDDVQTDLFFSQIDQGTGVVDVAVAMRNRLEQMLRSFDDTFDIVILDCAPGLSFATMAAIHIAERVIVPFRPDYVSQLAVDRVALMIEGISDLDELAAIPFARRRYTCLANFVRDNDRERLILQEIRVMHPVLNAQMPYRDGIAAAFDFVEQRSSIENKYGDAIEDIRGVYKEVSGIVNL